jgi:hypothetical protein
MGYIRHQVRREYEKNLEGKMGGGVETQLLFHLHWLYKGFSDSLVLLKLGTKSKVNMEKWHRKKLSD